MIVWKISRRVVSIPWFWDGPPDDPTGRPLTIRRVTRVEVIEEGNPTAYLGARGVVGGTEPAEAIIRRIRDAS